MVLLSIRQIDLDQSSRPEIEGCGCQAGFYWVDIEVVFRSPLVIMGATSVGVEESQVVYSSSIGLSRMCMVDPEHLVQLDFHV